MDNYSGLTKSSIALLIGLLIPHVSGYAMIWSVQIDPAEPTSQDTITFTVEGSFPDLCWEVGDYAFVQVTPTEYAASIFARDIWQPGMVCLQVIVDYAFSTRFGPLNPGIYFIQVTEHHESMREPWPDQRFLTFEVTNPMLPIPDLTISASGSDIVLRWTAMAGAIEYRIYRSATSEFELDPAHLIAGTSIPEYTDQNAVGLPGRQYFYNVTVMRP